MIIPKSSKMHITIWKDFTIFDILAMILFALLLMAVFMSNIAGKYYILMVLLAVGAVLFLEDDGIRMYVQVFQMLKYLFSTKKFRKNSEKPHKGIGKFIPFKSIDVDGTIEFNEGYYARVMSLGNIEFFLLGDNVQKQKMMLFTQFLDNIGSEQQGSLVKIERPINFDSNELDLRQQLDAATDDKVKYILQERYNVINSLNSDNLQYRPYFYFVLYDKSRETLNSSFDNMLSSAAAAGLEPATLNDKETAVFLKYGYNNDFDEREIDTVDPKDYLTYIEPQNIKFSSMALDIDNRSSFNLALTDYPLTVDGGWLAGALGILYTKTVVNFKPVDKDKAVRRCDNVISELNSKEFSGKASKQLAENTHVEAMQSLLNDLQNGNETLFDTSCIVTGYTEKSNVSKLRRQVRNQLRRDGLRVSLCGFRQQEAFISSNISRRVAVPFERGINSKTLGGSFPFCYANYVDPKGIILGENGYPVIVDFFKRGDKFTNSNMFIVGSSGSGKSYCTKNILVNLYSENCHLYVLDPTGEYNTLCANLGGRIIDVADSTHGIINPFHIYGDTETGGLFMQHLQFLEAFYRTVIPGIDAEAFEVLNNLTVELYREFYITSSTDINKLEAKDYPTFDDLYNVVEKAAGLSDSLKTTLLSYISKFTATGRYGLLWNGHSSLKVDSRFTTFNFEKLFANHNDIVANAQCLLVMKYLDTVLLNFKKPGSGHPVVVADEGHLFIDAKHPVALDFMYQKCKRMRHYNGMFLFITQNIKDLTSSLDVLHKTTAIINNSQYMFVLRLKPADMSDLVELFRDSGGINEQEKDEIVTNPRGTAFYIPTADERTSIKIIAPDNLVKLWEIPDCQMDLSDVAPISDSDDIEAAELQPAALAAAAESTTATSGTVE
jgi:type IV secretory pathway VirB4 component